LSYGYDNVIRAWRITPTSAATARVFDGHSDSIESAEYIEGGRRVVSIGDDGRLLVWTPDGTDAIELFASSTPLVALAVVASSDHAVVADREGAIWDVSPRGVVVQVRASHGGGTVLRASKDGRLLAIGDDDGVVGVYETRTWTLVKRLVTGVRAEQLQFDPAGRELLVVSADKHVRVLALDSRRVLPWSDLAAGALDIAYSSDGGVIALLCADGSEWFYRVPENAWVYVRDHRSRVTSGRFSSDGADFVSVDDQGAVIVRDIKSTFDMARVGLRTRSRS
jgi:WD40 repeat protein